MTRVGNNTPEIREIRAAAPALGLEISTSEIKQTDDLAFAFESLKEKADALYVCSDPLMNANRGNLGSLALAARLPTMHSFREYVEAGGLMSYGPSYTDLFRLAAVQVDKILKGKKPADLPVEQATKFELVLNLKTANSLGLELPAKVLALADDVIE
jgi:putative tryptophan/tyrosine transport system substrate-binding protein